MADKTGTGVDDRAMKSMSVAPPEPGADDKSAPKSGKEAKDMSTERELQRNPESKEARLDEAVEESMDASDPPSSTQPVHSTEPAPSSGYDAEAEAKRAGKGE